MIDLLLATLSGALLAASMPGPGLWPLAFVALGPWAIASARARTKRRAFAVDFALGFCFLVPTVFWLSRITAAAFLPVILVVPLFFVLAGALYRRLRRAMPATLALPLAWLVSEVARSYCPPGGFPWDLLGHAAAGWLDLAGIASLGGELLVSFVIALANGAIVDAIAAVRTPAARRRAWRPLAAGALVVAVSALAGARLRRDVGELVDGPLFAGMQPNEKQDLKDSELEDAFQKILDDELRLAAEASHRKPDVVVLPETLFLTHVLANGIEGTVKVRGAADAPAATYRREAQEMLEAFRRRIGAHPWFLTGVILLDRVRGAAEGAVRRHNSALLYDAADRLVARYDKRHLVPGAEGLPFLGTDPFSVWVSDTIAGLSGGAMVPDLAPGSDAPIFTLALADRPPVRFGVAICFDNAYADLFRDYARAGADFHVVLSNEGWFPDSFEMDAMLAFSAFRAIETRRSVLRFTNTGISCLVAPDGSLASALELGGRRSEIQGVFAARPPISRASTLFSKLGAAPMLVLAALAIAAAVIASRRFPPLP